MKYRCTSIPLTKLIATRNGFFSSLCDECLTLDCDNDVEIKKISIIGINIESKLLVKKDGSYIVIACEGYVKDAKRKFNNK